MSKFYTFVATLRVGTDVQVEANSEEEAIQRLKEIDYQDLHEHLVVERLASTDRHDVEINPKVRAIDEEADDGVFFVLKKEEDKGGCYGQRQREVRAEAEAIFLERQKTYMKEKVSI